MLDFFLILHKYVISKVNATELKGILIILVADLKAQGRKVMLMFNAGIGQAITVACSNNNYGDAIIMFHTKKSSKISSGFHIRHIKIKGTLFIIYTGLMIYANT